MLVRSEATGAEPNVDWDNWEKPTKILEAGELSYLTLPIPFPPHPTFLGPAIHYPSMASSLGFNQLPFFFFAPARDPASIHHLENTTTRLTAHCKRSTEQTNRDSLRK